MASLADFHFKCTKCGNCCSYPGLLVNLTPRDVKILAKQFHVETDVKLLLKVVAFYQIEDVPGQDKEDIQERLVFPPLKTHKGMAYLGLLKLPSGKCIFLKDNQCTIYPARPRICQSFPFSFAKKGSSPSISIARFATTSCPGMNQGPAVNAEKIKETGRRILAEIDECFSFSRWWNARGEKDAEAWKPERLLALMLRHRATIDMKAKG